MLMFRNKKRFMTQSISEHLHEETQVVLWQLIGDQVKEELELDYLQVFDLEIAGQVQQINHRQEVPERERIKVMSLHHAEPIKTTIWCIDDGENQLMLYRSEEHTSELQSRGHLVCR